MQVVDPHTMVVVPLDPPELDVTPELEVTPELLVCPELDVTPELLVCPELDDGRPLEEVLPLDPVC